MVKLSDFLRVAPAEEIPRSHCKTCHAYIGTGVETETCLKHVARAVPEVVPEDDKPDPGPRLRPRRGFKVSDEEFSGRLDAIRSRR
jgi:hypothetical protein